LWLAIGERAVQFCSSIVLVAAAIGLASCSQETALTEQQRICIAQRYPDYDAKQPRLLNQCIDVCKYCMAGNDVTCNTSCKLKGGS
jgi:hypothetical protein